MRCDMQKTLIRIGHSAYTGDNAMKLVHSKAAAVQELRSRGMLRDAARAVVNQVTLKDNGYATVYVRKELTRTNDIIECGLCEVLNVTNNPSYS